MTRLDQLTRLLTAAARQGAKAGLMPRQAPKTWLIKAEAYRRYGRSNTDRWLAEGLITAAGTRIDRQKLEAVAAASNCATYLSAAER